MNIPDYLKNSLTTGDGSDFKIYVSENATNIAVRNVHKFVIRQCPYFASLLDLNDKEAQEGSVTLEVDLNTMDNILSYLYLEILPNMSMRQAIQVASAAEYLQHEELKLAAIAKWQEEFWDIKDHVGMIEAFRIFVNSLNLKPAQIGRDIMETILGLIHYSSAKVDTAAESSAFIECLVNYYGQSHPCMSVDILSEWSMALGIKLSKEEHRERRKFAAQLLTKIRLLAMRLRSLVKLSAKKVFSTSYMNNILQKRLDYADVPTSGHVTYNVILNKNSVIELEYDTAYVLLWFKGFPTNKIASRKKPPNGETEMWEWLYWSKEFATSTVTIGHPSTIVGKCVHFTWPENVPKGFTDRSLSDFMNQVGKVLLKVTLERKHERRSKESIENEQYTYSLYYDE